jgi:ADP-heptose:LPS heptosyltransferase
VVRDEKIGDSLMAAPAIEAIARQANGPIYVLWRNQEVGEILAFPENVRPFGELNWTGIYRRDIIELDTWSSYGNRQPTTGHPTMYLFHQAGLAPPTWEQLQRPRLREIDAVGLAGAAGWVSGVPDFLVAPFAVDRALREFPLGDYRRLFTLLRDLYPGCKILVVGGVDDQARAVEHLGDCDVRFGFGLPLLTLAALISLTRIAVITVDSGPSHIAWAAKAATHVILMSNLLPPGWVSYPGAVLHRASTASLDAEVVAKLVYSGGA